MPYQRRRAPLHKPMTITAKRKRGPGRPFIKGHTINLGHHHSDHTKYLMAEKAKGRTFSDEHKRNIGITKLGNKYWVGRRHTEATKCKISDYRIAMIKAGGYIPANNFNNIKRAWHNINGHDIFFRSAWEYNYCLYLEYLVKHNYIKSWEYEKDIFWFENIRRGVRSYTPDFKVTNNNDTIEYHEVKGWMNAKSITKLNRMRIYYPAIKMVLIDKKVYTDLKRKIGRMLNFI